MKPPCKNFTVFKPLTVVFKLKHYYVVLLTQIHSDDWWLDPNFAQATITAHWNNDKTVPTIEDLEPRLYVADIKEINTGSECLFLKDYKSQFKEQYTKFAFSLVGENHDSLLDLVAPDEKTYNYWVDGIHTLMRRNMSSDDYKKERDILTNMEIKLRLLDLEGVDLPQEAPPIPPLPTDFNFASC